MRITRDHAPRVKYQRHGLRFIPEYRVWVGMRDRCYNPKAKSYCRYGARGIRVCARWNKSFSYFFSDVGPRPDKGWDLARIDPNKGYSPKNAVWQPHGVNMKNLRPRKCE